MSLPATRQRGFTRAERLHGSDFIVSQEVSNTTFKAGDTVFDITVDCGIAERLRLAAARYQRIQWNSATFQITAGFSSLASGQYVAAFVRDPTDVPAAGGDAKIRWAMANSANAMRKWWENTSLRMPRCPDLLWTSTDGKAPTFTSPGILVVVCVAPPQQPGTMSFMLDWDVTLSEPSLESTLKDGLFEYTHTLLRDAALTWYPNNETYAVLVQPTPPPVFNPGVHIERPMIDMADWGLGGLNPGTYLASDHPITYLAQFKAGGGEVESLVSTRLWKVDMYKQGTTSTERLGLSPILRFLKEDGSGYDIEPGAYVNSNSTDPHTWADVYSGMVVLHAGTRFGIIDPSAHYIPESYSVMRDGVKTAVPTGRIVKSRAAAPPNVDMIPFVRVIPTQQATVTVDNFPAVQECRTIVTNQVQTLVTNTEAEPIPTRLVGAANSVQVSNLPEVQDVNVTNNEIPIVTPANCYLPILNHHRAFSPDQDQYVSGRYATSGHENTQDFGLRWGLGGDVSYPQPVTIVQPQRLIYSDREMYLPTDNVDMGASIRIPTGTHHEHSVGLDITAATSTAQP